jgi:hypothetical protein
MRNLNQRIKLNILIDKIEVVKFKMKRIKEFIKKIQPFSIFAKDIFYFYFIYLNFSDFYIYL